MTEYVMLSEAKHLDFPGAKPFAALRVTSRKGIDLEKEGINSYPDSLPRNEKRLIYG